MNCAWPELREADYKFLWLSAVEPGQMGNLSSRIKEHYKLHLQKYSTGVIWEDKFKNLM